MDAAYDYENAKKNLERISGNRSVGDDIKYQLSMPSKDLTEDVYVTQYNNPKSLRLIKRCNEGGDPEEAVLRVQGILYQKDLPPVSKKPTDASKAIHMRQSVGLTGLGSGMFKDATSNIALIHTLFERSVKEGVLEPLSFNSFKDTETINSSNRYFTSKYQNRDAVQFPFSNNVDPLGILTSLSSDHLVHDEENIVEFFQFQEGDSVDENNYSMLNPVALRSGDIVEIQVSFVGVPLKGDKLRMMIVLRAITLLDCQDTMAAQLARSTIATVLPPKGPLKRKVGYEVEGRIESEARKRMEDLRME